MPQFLGIAVAAVFSMDPTSRKQNFQDRGVPQPEFGEVHVDPVPSGPDESNEPIFDKSSDTQRDPAVTRSSSPLLADQRRRASRSVVIWGVPLLILAGLAAIFIALRPHPANDARSRTLGVDVAPPALPDNKR